MLITSADLALLREHLRQADAPNRSFASANGKPRAEASLHEALRPHLPAILDAAEAICLLLAARRDPIGSDVDRAEHVEQILAELERT